MYQFTPLLLDASGFENCPQRPADELMGPQCRAFCLEQIMLRDRFF